MSFKPVTSLIDFPAWEREMVKHWYENGIVEKYLHRNDTSGKKFSFLDGPITANNPMGVHHAWGRTYKDLYQRFFNMNGYKERFQNGFDEQGLWVEVNVEKDLGLKNKRDIENLVPGDKFASLEKFVNLCKERVKKYSEIQTDQSKRLGYFMDWSNSYHTSSDQNNYTIWHFLKQVFDKGWLYQGHDSVPWCPRCGTAISQHEILTEEYKELTHDSVFFKLPLAGKENEYLLVWTTTPWTIPANVAVAVNPEETYIGFEVGGEKLWVIEKTLERLVKMEVLSRQKAESLTKLRGREMVGWEYVAPFDEFERVKGALGSYHHRVVASDERILPVSADEGTGLVHVATGAGTEDFQLGKKEGLPVVDVIDEEASYLPGLGEFSGQNAKTNPELILDYLKQKDGGRFILKTYPYTHRYPTCWRCKTELVWRVVDEWYIAMDRTDSLGKTYREQMIEVAKQINWVPAWGLDRELDWLKNMHDWLISKKRYWGLALPIWVCSECGSFEVIGGFDELKARAVSGWNEFEGHTPHRPWVDQIKLKCPKCQGTASRIPDVGNPWLDAGIVPFSTLPEEFSPADFVTESFPGQFKNWFYSLIAMSTVLKGEAPFKNLLGYATVVDEQGEEMHKSKGNSIEFNEAADKAGVDVMRWLYATGNPEANLRFGFNTIEEVKRRFYLILWNTYKFFLDRAIPVNWSCELERGELSVLDRWALARLTEVVLQVNRALKGFDAQTAAQVIEEFVVNDLSTWYVRRVRDRVGPSAEERDRATVLGVLYGNLVTLSKLAAPFMPFISEEIYRNLTSDESVHLTDYPQGDSSLLDDKLIADMKLVREIVEQGHSKRKEAGIKLRQPLAKVSYSRRNRLDPDSEKIIGEELNVKAVEYINYSEEMAVSLNTDITLELQEEGEARELIRAIQQLRKEANLTLGDKIQIKAPKWPKRFEELVLKSTVSVSITEAPNLEIVKV